MIFISFAPRDLEDALRCRDLLLEDGESVWVPTQDYKIGKGRVQAIKDSSKFVLVASPLGRQSRLCKLEKAIAIHHNIPCYLYDSDDISISPDIEPITSSAKQSDLLSWNSNPKLHVPMNDLQSTDNSMRDVFLSFASTDEEDVKTIRSAFQNADIQWWDFISSDRQFDMRISQEIEKAISNSQVFLAVQSAHYENSGMCKDEYEYAVALRKRILHVQFKPMRPTLRTAGRPYIDCLNKREEGLEKIVDAVNKLKASYCNSL
jgi:hypothetical protein